MHDENNLIDDISIGDEAFEMSMETAFAISFPNDGLKEGSAYPFLIRSKLYVLFMMWSLMF